MGIEIGRKRSAPIRKRPLERSMPSGCKIMKTSLRKKKEVSCEREDERRAHRPESRYGGQVFENTHAEDALGTKEGRSRTVRQRASEKVCRLEEHVLS